MYFMIFSFLALSYSYVPSSFIRHHTRAYIRHLLLAKELLGEMLVYHHNQHQLLRLFEMTREKIKAGTFAEWSEELLEKA